MQCHYYCIKIFHSFCFSLLLSLSLWRIVFASWGTCLTTCTRRFQGLRSSRTPQLFRAPALLALRGRRKMTQAASEERRPKVIIEFFFIPSMCFILLKQYWAHLYHWALIINRYCIRKLNDAWVSIYVACGSWFITGVCPRSIIVESIFILNGCGCRITVCVVICIICYMSWISSSKHIAFQLLSVVQVSILYIMQRELIQGFYNFLGLVIFCSLSYKLMWKLLNTLMTSVSELILETDL